MSARHGIETYAGRRQQRGAALVLALSLLAVFSMLGTYYLQSMQLAVDTNTLSIRSVRAHEAAVAGIEAAIGGLYTGLQEDQLHLILGKEREIVFPVYKGVVNGETHGIEAENRFENKAVLSIEDESGRVNLNHAPASVLQSLLGIDGETARKLASSLPHAGGEAGLVWLVHPDELVSRGFLSEAAYAALDKTLLTTSSVAAHDTPAPYLNVNSASSAVLAALLGVPLQKAEELRAQRPYKTLEALAQAAGADLGALSMAPMLRTDSQCFRIRSTGVIGRSGGAGDQVSATLEAVVLFDGLGAHRVVSWTQIPTGSA
ncbi:MAG: general secretion pathway protein GspK [Candidatus Hydrogenedentes bacterium]|nr:general secretion pathway protein GspK [Candidatus Hydrogenedentota bacterium]